MPLSAALAAAPFRIGVALALLSVGPAAEAQAQAAGPRLCWRSLSSIPAGTSGLRIAGATDRLAVTDGAHPAARLELVPGGRPFVAQGDDPNLFVRWPDGEVVSVWALDRGPGVRELTVRIVEREPTACTVRGSEAGPVVAVEALSEGAAGARTCIGWPLAAGAPSSDPRWGASCFPLVVPNVVRLPVVEAVEVLEESRLQEQESVRETRFTTGLPELVVAQEPTAGSRLVTGDAVALTVSATDQVRVPDLSGRSVSAASSILVGLGVVELVGLAEPRPRLELSVPAVTDPAELTGDYRIARQRPPAGNQVPVPATVEVEVALLLPDLRGRTTADAGRWLCERGLVPEPGGCDRLAAPPTRASTVRAHSPAAREQVFYGARVAIESETELPPVVRAPNIQFMTVDQAEAELATQDLELGLEGRSRSESIRVLERWRTAPPRHRLNRQQPRPGEPMAGRTTVTARIEVVVPRVRWWQVGRASDEVVKQRLESRPQARLGAPTRAASQEIVVGQDPQPDVWRPAGSLVLLQLDSGGIDDPPGPDWLKIVLALLAIGGLAAVPLRPRFKRLPAKLRVEPHTDYIGSQRLQAEAGRSAAPAFRLRPRWDPGRQTIETSGDSKGEPDG